MPAPRTRGRARVRSSHEFSQIQLPRVARPMSPPGREITALISAVTSNRVRATKAGRLPPQASGPVAGDEAAELEDVTTPATVRPAGLPEGRVVAGSAALSLPRMVRGP